MPPFETSLALSFTSPPPIIHVYHQQSSVPEKTPTAIPKTTSSAAFSSVPEITPSAPLSIDPLIDEYVALERHYSLRECHPPNRLDLVISDSFSTSLGHSW